MQQKLNKAALEVVGKSQTKPKLLIAEAK